MFHPLSTVRNTLKVRVCVSSSVYRKKYLQQIRFLNNVEPFSVQSLHELIGFGV